jgi:predicted small lipoprotein YifL
MTSRRKPLQALAAVTWLALSLAGCGGSGDNDEVVIRTDTEQESVSAKVAGRAGTVAADTGEARAVAGTARERAAPR